MRRRIACAQLLARDLADAPRALEDAEAAVQVAGARGADLCVLPEGTYPAYVLGDRDAARAVMAAGPDPVAVLGAAARAANVEVIVGLVLERGAELLNAAVHLGADGEVRNAVAKQFLWHFDAAWFAPGDAGAVVDGVGMLVCADGRLPEIAGGLATAGAGLLVNTTAWVVARPSPAGTNAQAEFLWRVRAIETGCAAVACTKVGTEAGVAMYAGKSQIVAPDGTLVAVASPTEPELLVADVDVPDDARPPVDRAGPRPEARPWGPPLRPGIAHVAVVTATAVAARLDAHGCALVAGPEGILRVERVAATTLRDDDLLVPGPAREAAFAGVEVIVWVAARVSTPFVEELARARATENRVFVAVWRPVETGGPFIVGPSGTVIASGPAGAADFAVSASCVLAEAATKEIVPGTDIFDGVLRLGTR